jgi:hypothetical protein
MDADMLSTALSGTVEAARDEVVKAGPLAIASAVVAFLSFLFNWNVVRRQDAMQAMSLRAAIEADLMKWGFASIDALSQVDELARTDNFELTPRSAREVLCTRLSTLIDQGRLIFPNQMQLRLGQDRNSAFQGIRPAIQDALVLVHDELNNPTLPGPEFLTFVRSCRRIYVSELQRSVAPRVKRALLDRLHRVADTESQGEWGALSVLVESFEGRHKRSFWQEDHPMREQPKRKFTLLGRKDA